MTSVLLPLLRDSKGRIVNIVSCAGRTAAGLMGPYCASKFGMEAITDTMRLELQQFGISVSAIEPGIECE
jgi:NAD(P)-dependent dehydrogenase (short-subunit alcohol dehydrogenase family)